LLDAVERFAEIITLCETSLLFRVVRFKDPALDAVEAAAPADKPLLSAVETRSP
jgi:hypothetical protein